MSNSLGVEAKLTLRDLVLLLQAIIVIGGGFYFVGQLGSKMEHLVTTVEKLEERQTIALRVLDKRVTVLERESR